ncbi:MAG: hypothetical protein MUC79_11780 [Thiobacillaceae bacterium]|jgi:hypothetical protein|nr:hypothetical protein [Thiobacillaceae bacterium]
MNTKHTIAGLTLALTLTSGLAAAGTTSNTTVKQILLYEAGDLVYVYPTLGVTAPPGCAGANAYYSFSMSRPRAKEYLAGLMAAQVAGLTVTFTGTGACTDHATSETLAYYSVTK